MSHDDDGFYPIFISSVHDLKNSLIMSLGTLDEMEENCQKTNDKEGMIPVNKLQYELQRINNSLIQLLSLYKMDNDLCAINIDQQNVHEFLYEGLLQNRSLRESQEIEVHLNCDEELEWFFDRDLVAGIISTIINNSCRYAKKEIILSSEEKDGFLQLIIEDDGNGFPPSILEADGNFKFGVNFISGSTGLGLHFADEVARLHKRGDLVGSVKLENRKNSGGGRFILSLP
ncbi:MAG: HAMP domain-containing histidine kinase [Methylococcales bacterium]|jgi:two-component system, OmpR family, sensor histidine kinase SenX3|nr:HAMP domain-containing histidine kinase [Methylococcales bacterium]MBT7408617.1 HAMP domain-containing histidine kinase [Methylococcales bacterium]